jgi:DNA-binding CsgD family transcriptional regulator
MTASRASGIVRAMIGHGGTALGAPRGSGGPLSGPSGDSADLAAAVLALEARKALLAGAVAALTAPDSHAAELCEAALADPGARLWPFDLARVYLLYGERLRRSQEITRSRQHLQAALAAFERLGAFALADRSAPEPPTTAPTRQRQEVSREEPLTAQEIQVAELAAAGLSNREIGDRLYMSHRTVGCHLYRIFPKLGIRSRAALRDALSRRVAAQAAPRVTGPGSPGSTSGHPLAGADRESGGTRSAAR